MAKFKTDALNISPLLLEKLLLAYTSGHAPSRVSVSKSCNVSKTTSGKVAAALLKCGFMSERFFSKPGEKSAAHLLFEDRTSILLIDFSSSAYKMCIVHPNGSFLFESSYEYDPTASFNDNINIFLSRNGLNIKRSGITYSALCILYADDGRRSSLEESKQSISIPCSLQKEYIDNAVLTILGKRVSVSMTVSEAISEAVRFGMLLKDNTSMGISYIFVGSRVSSCHIFRDGSAIVCSPRSILTDDERRDINRAYYIPKSVTDAIFVHISDFMDAAFSPSALLLESDIHKADSATVEKIIRKFSITGRNIPIIYTRESDFPPAYIGIARSAIFKVIKNYITSDKS